MHKTRGLNNAQKKPLEMLKRLSKGLMLQAL
jgi:hypothetical protein